MNLTTDRSVEIAYQAIPNGVFAKLQGRLGTIEATIHCKFSSLKPFRVCFATCTGHAHPLQGKVRDFPTMESIKSELQSYQQAFDGQDTDTQTNAELRFNILADQLH